MQNIMPITALNAYYTIIPVGHYESSVVIPTESTNANLKTELITRCKAELAKKVAELDSEKYIVQYLSESYFNGDADVLTVHLTINKLKLVEANTKRPVDDEA